MSRSGNATAGDVLSGKTFSNAGGAGSGTMPNNGAVSIIPGTSVLSIAAGYHNGAGTVAGDADLVAGNIMVGINLFGVTGTALPAQPLRTGQTQCDLGGGTMGACPGSPAGQDGALGKGLARSYTDNGNGTITDNRTGLTWEKLSDDGSIHDKDNVYTWSTTFTSKIATLNSGGGFAGFTDWRLPNRFELETILDLGRFGAAVDPVFNTSCVASCTVTTCSCTPTATNSLFWSSTSVQPAPTYAWYVNFYDGLAYPLQKTLSSYARAVRGG